MNTANAYPELHDFFSDPLHRLIARQLNVGLVILDSNNLIQWANQVVLDWYQTGEKLEGQPAQVLFDQGETSKIDALLSAGAADGSVTQKFSARNQPDKFLVSVFPLPQSSQAQKVLVFHLLGEQVGVDSIPPNRLDARQEILNHIPVAVMTFDSSFSCTFANSTAERMFTVRSQDAVGVHIREIFAETLTFTQDPLLTKITATNSPASFVEEIQSKHAEKTWYHFTILPQNERILLVASDITQRKLAEQQILQREDQLRGILDSTYVPLLLINLDGRIVYANQQINKLLGYGSADELIGTRAFDLVAPEEQSAAEEALAQYIINDPDRSYEFTLVGKDSRKVLVKINAKLISNPTSKQHEILLSLEDITEKRRAENIQNAIYQIAEAAGHPTSLEDLYATIHATIQGIMPADNFYISIFNQEQSLITFPYFVDENDDYPNEVPPENLEKSITMYVLRRGESLLCPKHVSDALLAAGEVKVYGAFPAIWLGVPLILEGSTIGVMAVQHYSDPQAYTVREQRVLEFVSTEVAKAIQRKKAEQALIESEKRFRSVVQSTPIGVNLFRLLPDERLVLITSNAAADQILGISSTDLQGGVLEEIFPHLFDPKISSVFRDIARDGGHYHDQFIDHDENGKIRFALDFHAFQPSRNELAIHFQDITSRIRSEDEIRTLNEELEQRVYQRTVELEASNREMEAFAYSVSHDLRAPVRAIKGFSEILLSEEEAADKQALISRIVESGARMDQLINDLLALSRLGSQTLDLEPVNLSQIAKSLLEEVAENAPEEQINFQVEECPSAAADEDMVRILLTNLISNAVKFSASREVSEISFGFKNENGQIIYYLADNGIGFDMQYADKIFSPFERLHAAEYEGTGIGLAIVNRVIRRHEGSIWVDSTPGQGTTFYFTLDQSPLT